MYVLEIKNSLFSNRSHSLSPKIPASGSCAKEKNFLLRYFEAKEMMRYSTQ